MAPHAAHRHVSRHPPAATWQLKIAKGIGEVEVKPRDEVTAECKLKCKDLKPKKVKK